MEEVSHPEVTLVAPSKPADRRAEPRLRCAGIAEIILLPAGLRYSGTLLDLSTSGCSIETVAPMQVSESRTVEVQLTIEGARLRVAGMIRNLRRNRQAGIQFVGVTERKAKQITDLLEEIVSLQLVRKANLKNLGEFMPIYRRRARSRCSSR
jgi:predicted ABC-class ATPase